MKCLKNRCLLLGEGNGTPLQYSRLENPMDGGAWWAAVHGVAKSQTRLSDFTFTFPCIKTFRGKSLLRLTCLIQGLSLSPSLTLKVARQLHVFQAPLLH